MTIAWRQRDWARTFRARSHPLLGQVLLDEIIPEALRRGVHMLALILDNCTTHAPKQLEQWLKDQIRATGGY